MPEGRGTFSELTVWENLRLGAYTRRGSIQPESSASTPYFPWLTERRSQQAGTLSGGEQQMLALARAFVQRPRLLLLDEPSLGLAPVLVAEIFRIVRELNEKEGLTVLVVEQNAHLALQAARRRLRARGRPRRPLGLERGAAEPTTPSGASYLGYWRMASAETSPIAGLRARGGAIDGGSAAVVLLLIGAAIFLLVGCLAEREVRAVHRRRGSRSARCTARSRSRSSSSTARRTSSTSRRASSRC